MLAYETGAAVTVVLTKADLAESEEQVEQVADRVRALAGPDVRTLVVSDGNAESVEAVRALMPPAPPRCWWGSRAWEVQAWSTCSSAKRCRKRARCARVTARAVTPRSAARWWPSPAAGTWWTCPALHGLGLWDADAGIGAAFADIEQAAQQCRFRDCKHENEPGCAVRAAVKSGEIAPERFASYEQLDGTATLRDRREEARGMRGEKASDKKRGGQGGRPGRGKRRR